MKLPYSVSRIANLLTLHGIPIEDIAEWDDLQDGEIIVTKNISVQIGEYYIHVVHMSDEGLWMEKGNLRPGQLVNRLKELLK